MCGVKMKLCHSAAVLTALVTIINGCNVPVKHYTSMKCTPIGNSRSSGCPERFDCSSLTQHDNNKCYFNGKTYALTDRISQVPYTLDCWIGCSCQMVTTLAQFRCYVHCPNKQINLANCTFNGETFLAGQKMYPSSNNCFSCTCHEDFNEANISFDPHCYESDCIFELSYYKEVYSGGVPVYYKDRCCPWEWRMPKDSDRLVEGTGSTKKTTNDSAMQCKYGKLTMNVGDSLVPEDTEQFTYKCSCQIPPLAHCVITENNKE